MNRSVLWAALLVVGFAASPTVAQDDAVANPAEACNPAQPHATANFCQSYPGGDLKIDACCEDNCLKCHGNPKDDPALDGTTGWNSRSARLVSVYKVLAATDAGSLADLCLDCHEERFSERINHPVEVAYGSDDQNLKFVANPEGLRLVCSGDGGAAEGGQGCLLRCVTCHKVHPRESEGNQVQGLLRVTNAGSALCLKCHVR